MHTTRPAPKRPAPVTTTPILLGALLGRARRQRGLSQRQVAELVDIGQSTWSRVERGEVDVGVAQLRRICSVLKLDTPRLLSALDSLVAWTRAQGVRLVHYQSGYDAHPWLLPEDVDAWLLRYEAARAQQAEPATRQKALLSRAQAPGPSVERLPWPGDAAMTWDGLVRVRMWYEGGAELVMVPVVGHKVGALVVHRQLDGLVPFGLDLCAQMGPGYQATHIGTGVPVHRGWGSVEQAQRAIGRANSAVPIWWDEARVSNTEPLTLSWPTRMRPNVAIWFGVLTAAEVGAAEAVA